MFYALYMIYRKMKLYQLIIWQKYNLWYNYICKRERKSLKYRSYDERLSRLAHNQVSRGSTPLAAISMIWRSFDIFQGGLKPLPLGSLAQLVEQAAGWME